MGIIKTAIGVTVGLVALNIVKESFGGHKKMTRKVMVKGHLRKVKGQKAKVRVRGHLMKAPKMRR